jgi:uncharacterized membrane protein YjjP (DUF1212 family)
MYMANGYSNWKNTLWVGDTIPHYYGDWVRTLFILMAALTFVVTPLLGDLLPFGVLPQVAASLLLVLLAGLTSPRSQVVMLINATLAGVSAFLLETYAILLGPSTNVSLFWARELGVLLMLAALYFSVKTLRAMMSGKMGHADSPLEFGEPVAPLSPHTPPSTTDRASYDG